VILKKNEPAAPVAGRWIGTRYRWPSTAEMEFFQAYVGMAARFG
jgi:hypothetical protein